MSLLGVHEPAAAALAALAVPIVVLYFLRLKRPRSVVPSLVLWRAVIEDKRVNAPFQRFRRHLPLWLQLLVLAGLVAGAVLPYWARGPQAIGREPILIDCSAAMGALSAPAGPTRLELAKRFVRDRIEHLAPGEQLCLVAFAGQARRMSGFTDDRHELEDALQAITVEQVPARLDNALQMAQGLWRGAGFTQALLVSDGDVPAAVDADLAFHIDYHRIDAPVANAGITALDAQRRPDGRWDVFCAVDSSAQAPDGLSLRLSNEDGPIIERPLTLDSEGSARVVVTVAADHPQAITAELHASGFDALAADDRATVSLPALRPVRIWVAPGAAGWRRALAGQEDVELLDAVPPTPPGGDPACDLVVTDRAGAPEGMVTFSDGVIPTALASLLSSSPEGHSAVVDWRRADPLLAHVSLGDLVIAQSVSWAPGADEAALENAGWTVAIHGDAGPLMVVHRQAGRCQAALLIPSEKSTLPYRVGFPVLAANLVQAARAAIGQSEAHAVATGVLPAQRAPPLSVVRLDGPSGAQQVTADSDGLANGLRLERPGLYHLVADGTSTAIGAGLLSRQVTRLASVESIRFHEQSLTAAEATAPGERALWPWACMMALLVCLFEWWYVHRRPWQPA